MKIEKGDPYTCARCQQIFVATSTHDEAIREREVVFPSATEEECDVVCDDCWNFIVGGEGH